MHEQRDVATIERLENEWSLAYLRGDTAFEQCLLTRDFREILRTGKVVFLPDELDLARNNQGKNLPLPTLPKPTVMLHGNVAVAYGTSTSQGKTRETHYADYYLWEDGAWHAFFAQQTSVDK